MGFSSHHHQQQSISHSLRLPSSCIWMSPSFHVLTCILLLLRVYPYSKMRRHEADQSDLCISSDTDNWVPLLRLETEFSPMYGQMYQVCSLFELGIRETELTRGRHCRVFGQLLRCVMFYPQLSKYKIKSCYIETHLFKYNSYIITFINCWYFWQSDLLWNIVFSILL